MAKPPNTIAGVAEAAALKEMALQPGVPKPIAFWVRRIVIWLAVVALIGGAVGWVMYYLLQRPLV